MSLHWLDNADSWICPVCGFETSSPAKYEGCKCPKCGFQDEKDKTESEDKEKLSWLGKNCKDCGNEKCKKLGTLPKGYDCASWQPESEGINMTHEITAKMNLKNVIEETRDVSRALYEFADKLEQIEKKYAESQESEE